MIMKELDLLFQISGQKTPSPIELPIYGKLHNIDLNTREIESPDFLGV